MFFRSGDHHDDIFISNLTKISNFLPNWATYILSFFERLRRANELKLELYASQVLLSKRFLISALSFEHASFEFERKFYTSETVTQVFWRWFSNIVHHMNSKRTKQHLKTPTLKRSKENVEFDSSVVLLWMHDQTEPWTWSEVQIRPLSSWK